MRKSRIHAFTPNPLLKVQLPAGRSRFAMFALSCAFLALVARALWLQVWSNDFLQRQGEVRFMRTLEMPATRGGITDRTGVILAKSLPARAIFANPGDAQLEPAQIAELSKLLGMPERDLTKRLASDSKTFVYLKRQVDAPAAEKIAALKLPGVHQLPEYKRHYPDGSTIAHVVGFTNVEDVGQEGIELIHQKGLAGHAGARRVMQDRMGNIIEDVGTLREPQDGSDLQLSIDTRIQYHVFDAVRDAVNAHRAVAGAAVVLDAQTGEVLALANLPTYDPNERGALSGAQLRNRVMTDSFEPGSTFKPFAISAALEAGIVKPNSMVNCAGKLTIGTASIGDAHGHGTLSVEEVLQKSSNVGTAKIALQLPPQRMWDLYTALGFGQAPEVGFPGAVAGRVRPWKTWKPIEQATMSYGHGVSVSLLQLARAYTVFARDGEVIPLTFLKSEQPAVGKRVMAPETARAVRHMLELAAGPGGTAPKAQIPGFSVAGKTGTAHKLEGGRYVTRYVSSFVGFAPVSNPRVIIAVMIDEPSAGEHYGGTVAAPIFARIASDTMRTLRVTPDIPLRADAGSDRGGAAVAVHAAANGGKPAPGRGPMTPVVETSSGATTVRSPLRGRGNA